MKVTNKDGRIHAGQTLETFKRISKTELKIFEFLSIYPSGLLQAVRDFRSMHEFKSKWIQFEDIVH